MRHAFSLVELSIVLVILGLLTGGILAGQSLIHAAELRKTTSDITRFKTALGTFRDKYFAIPGDMPNATKFWNAADGGDGLGADCSMASAAGTCNGNGNGFVDGGPGGGEGLEYYRFWQQLNLSGLLEGSYTGYAGPAATAAHVDDIIGTNIPRNPINSNAGYAVSMGWSGPARNGFGQQNTLTIASCCHPAFRNIEGQSVPSEDAWNIDTKMDDGKPGFGSMQIYAAYGGEIDASNYILSGSAQVQPLYAMGL